MSLAFLVDENISPETAAFLEAQGHSCRSLRRDGPWRLADPEIVALAKREGRIILTHDLDFAQIYYFAEHGQVGVIVLRLRHQTVEAVNAALGRFLHSPGWTEPQIQYALITLSETTYRIYQEAAV